jgi:hypothetical protein
MPKHQKKPVATPVPASAPTSEWDPNVQAHAQAWMYLFMKEELLTSFPDSQGMKMEQLAWWNGLATPDVRRLDAQKLAIAIHRFFRDAMKRPYEKEFAENSLMRAIQALTDTLIVADATVPALAAVVNRIFRFKDEK